jgi:hypothetical protein
MSDNLPLFKANASFLANWSRSDDKAESTGSKKWNQMNQQLTKNLHNNNLFFSGN